MSEYKDIHGTNIETVASDPSNPVNGQIWYNSTDQKLKGNAQTTLGTWATSGNLNQARRRLSGAGPATAGLAISGTNDPPYFANVEQYNGSAWTEIADVNEAKEETAAAGKSATSILLFGGNKNASPKTTGETESWNGSAWTEVADLNSIRSELAGAGASNTSAIAFGGVQNPGALTESWNGTSWSETADLNQRRDDLMGCGIITSALAFGGEIPPGTKSAHTESWNGTSWTELADLNTARNNGGGTGDTNTACLMFGGLAAPARTANTELWNGTSWSEQNNLNTARSNQGEFGSAASAVSCGGNGPTNATEEWTGAGADSTQEFDLSQMARVNFLHFVPRPKPRKRPGRHRKNLNKHSTFKKYNRQGR